MILTDKEREDFETASKPLIKFLNDNCHPHVTVIVDTTSAELLEGIESIGTEEYLKD